MARGTCLARGGGHAPIDGDLSSARCGRRVFDQALAGRRAASTSWSTMPAGPGASTPTRSPRRRTQELIELNLKSVLFLSQRFVAHARERGGGGSIIQISSTAGIAGFERRAVYCATKFAVIGSDQGAGARSCARRHPRQRRTAACRRNRDVPDDRQARRKSRLWRAGIPMGRFATVEDVAALWSMFLCSPAAAYLTGGVYPVDGGAMAGPFGGDS